MNWYEKVIVGICICLLAAPLSFIFISGVFALVRSRREADS